MKKNIFWMVLATFTLFLLACKKETQIKEAVSGFLGFQKPAHFPEPVYKFANNKVTEGGFKLGRALFYEARLSRNNTVSCGSCHIQSSAFTQHGHEVSHGIDDRLGTRNSPPIMNLAWNKAFMWGGGVFDLDLQPIVPITAHEEMDETLENVMAKLRTVPKYPTMFKTAFGTEEITTARFMKALSQFMLMCVSANAKYDKVMRKEAGATFTADEAAGYALFKTKCASCHSEPLFTDNGFHNNGLAPSNIDDQGLYTATLIATDKYKFKAPSLRNLSYTAPYMHDGRFLTLNGVFEHYNSEVQATPNLDPLLQQNGKRGISLSTDDRAKLTAFLKTLDDTELITRQDLSEQ
ncbi:cytochrome-c peroxidase [Mucilaginibacter myungsuensis]|uniref:C-type cytochrome n=1 Tax=Mucilaginibacter myungsuensis TaxID=649104 RepID=A0A929KZE9_9SPHI|nr:cytochrome c peroxidase [Mucilaginibacter myungsuensis]MBE9661380.1 c-type cytochrome [Mucilaginibacter myungsuensis]MDN3597523.1 cytochrome c peroxidase [Mucilaginibacter myungsuensis]